MAAAASLLAAGLLTACNQLTGTLTVDFVYVTSSLAAGPNSYGEVDVFEIDSESGKMRQIPTSPFPSGGRNPVAEAVAPDQTNLYVVNQDDNSIVQFVIGNDGKLYPQDTVNTPGIFPVATAVGGKILVRSRHLSAATYLFAGLALFGIDHRISHQLQTTRWELHSPTARSALSYWPLIAARQPHGRSDAHGHHGDDGRRDRFCGSI